MLRDALLAVVDRDGAVQRESHADRMAGQRGGHAVAIAADLDVRVPADLTRFPVRRVVAPGWQRLERRDLPGEALGHHLAHRAVHARVGFLPQPLLGELIEMSPTLERAIADEEVVLHVADVAFILALGLGAGGATSARAEAIVAGQVHEPRVELDVAATPMRDDGGLLIVDENFGGRAAEPLEGAHERLIGMLGILAVRPPEVEAARVAERAHREVHRDGLSRNDGGLDRPVRLQLSARLGLEAHRRSAAGAQRSLGPDVVPENRDAARVALRLQLPQDHHRVPHSLAEQLIDHGSVGIEQTPTPTSTPGRRPTTLQRPPDRPRVHAQLLRDVAQVDTAFDHCLKRHEVLQSQHAVPPPDVAIGEGTFSLVVGGLPISAFSRLLPSAPTQAATNTPRSGNRKANGPGYQNGPW